MSISLENEMVHLAPEHQLRAILLSLCDDSSVCKRALNHYGALKAADNPTTGLKRKACNDLFVCVQCDEVYTNEDNTNNVLSLPSCVLGDLEVDDSEDFWADHDENCHGEIDTPEMREEVPDGFRWSCCSKLGGTGGCTKGKHQADPARSQRGGDVPAGSNLRKNHGSHGAPAEKEEEEDDDDDDDNSSGDEDDDEDDDE
ncbi:hypothetical protein FGSG_00785 [Fusarium graminearum PH-1]|uniref:Chromosome 1, complete genome n=1 Tax=Gibberella zeae (strain ATCC MYA-4620 / CBS 123657 / FGSC 9075 / NRRL 31084 / PH-1) TaxID=229533 RepID=I1RB78_GIBZE|nr:hypothetical protein FGSG_00785 [Fusarium graminearum PH-1]ESU06011.1 hypothetical protein FGSG_00785 [Fusarium graminearum PH-1]CAF3584720.1 unnamed protein product [Fusarium graminearum]CEF72785.1 unnamed protein product [Fusarium graminearum]|eukprot:XP_011316496.1 hypothetical protein FGSG_00785 [Fusarium graminearum PH-1]